MTRKLASITIGFLVLISLACQAVANLPNPFATATPTATPTFTPSPTPSPTPTSTSTPTPLPTGRAKISQPNGSTDFVDYDYGYKLNAKKGWTVVSLDEEDINQLAKMLSKTSPNDQSAMDMIQSMNPEVDRALLFDFKDTSDSGYTPNVIFSVEDHPILQNMSITEIVQALQDTAPRSKDIQIISAEVKTNALGLELGDVKVSYNDRANGIKLYQELIYFKSSKATMYAELFAELDSRDTVAPLFNQIVDSIQILK